MCSSGSNPVRPWSLPTNWISPCCRRWVRPGCPKASRLAVMTPGTHAKHYLAGALEVAAGTRLHYLGPRKTNVLFRALIEILDASSPAERYARLYVVVDH